MEKDLRVFKFIKDLVNHYSLNNHVSYLNNVTDKGCLIEHFDRYKDSKIIYFNMELPTKNCLSGLFITMITSEINGKNIRGTIKSNLTIKDIDKDKIDVDLVELFNRYNLGIDYLKPLHNLLIAISIHHKFGNVSHANDYDMDTDISFVNYIDDIIKHLVNGVNLYEKLKKERDCLVDDLRQKALDQLESCWSDEIFVDEVSNGNLTYKNPLYAYITSVDDKLVEKLLKELQETRNLEVADTLDEDFEILHNFIQLHYALNPKKSIKLLLIDYLDLREDVMELLSYDNDKDVIERLLTSDKKIPESIYLRIVNTPELYGEDIVSLLVDSDNTPQEILECIKGRNIFYLGESASKKLEELYYDHEEEDVDIDDITITRYVPVPLTPVLNKYNETHYLANAKYLVEDYYGCKIMTAPLLFDTTYDLLFTSSINNDGLYNGKNITLSTEIKLDKIYLGSVDEIFEIDMSGHNISFAINTLPTTGYIDVNNIIITFDIRKEPKFFTDVVKNNTNNIFANIDGNYKLQFIGKLKGYVNYETSELTLRGEFILDCVYDENDEIISRESSLFKTINSMIIHKEFSLLGYSLHYSGLLTDIA